MRWFTDLIDKHTERAVRQVAHNHGRRSLITRLGVALVGGAALPMLPFDRSGQFGAALRYQPPGSQANFGFYAMRYHDKGPNIDYANPAAGTGAEFRYLEGRTLYGASTNFALGDWAIGAELSYRPKDAVALNPLWNNTINGNFCLLGGKCYVEEKKYQMHLTGLLSMTPGDYSGILNFLGADTATLMAEAVLVRYPGMKSAYAGVPVAAGYWGWGFLNAGDTVEEVEP